ncbi:MAG: SpoIID/LytB domain-containing protein [Ignavibacteriales bacterium]|nr:SpoIID/LytB domain-containing protein [Ignavibacteriales bacterium]
MKITEPVFLYNSEKKIALIKSNNTLLFRGASRAFQAIIMNRTFESDEFILQPVDSNGSIEYNNRTYPGKLRFKRINNEIFVINNVALEPYVQGVVVPELGKVDSNTTAAIEAMAVCARTYAANKLAEFSPNYDIEASTQDQVYHGKSKNLMYNKYVENTKGQILTFQSELAKVFYHACCGGLTEDAQNVFKVEALPYLCSVKDGEPAYCSDSPVFQWKEEYTEPEFLELLIQAGFLKVRNHESISKIEISETFPSGRTKTLSILMSDGSSILIPSELIRPVIRRKSNKGILRTNFIDISIADDASEKRIIIKGRGNGHGVGMCQWGAMGMAKKGVSYMDILAHYYPGTNITLLND